MAKKTLLELMVEAGVKWPEGAEYAAQSKCDNKVHFFKIKPKVLTGDEHFCAPGGAMGGSCLLPSLCGNWHQTIVTKAQYEKAMTEQPDQPPTIEAQPCVSATPATIEQRIAELRVMERNLAEFRAKLTDDLHALGLTWRDGAVVADEPNPEPKPEQPIITDWRDLRVGDVVGFDGIDGEYTVSDLESEHYSGCKPIKVAEDVPVSCHYTQWPDVSDHPWRFIRRP